MIQPQKIKKIVEEYDKDNIVISTVCSHSSLQIFAGAKLEGFKTLGIAIAEKPKVYDAFPKGKPDEFIIVKDYIDIMDISDELVARNVILIPHGSFVEYLGAKNFENLAIPTFGNRAVLEWESDRDKSRKWLCDAGLKMPEEIKNPEDIDKPVIVKYHGAKGGKNFFIAQDYNEFKSKIDLNKKYTIQEIIFGNGYYFHYFYSPITQNGYRVGEGSLELMGMDRRDETNIDGATRFLSFLSSIKEREHIDITPSFVVCGNIPLVMRESILGKVMDIGEKTILKSIEYFGGLIGPFCLETIIDEQLEIYIFEISARIVAGTNLYISGSPYSDLIEENMSTGRRIAREIKNAIKKNQVSKVVS